MSEPIVGDRVGVLKPLADCVDILDRFRKPVNSRERASRVGEIPYYGATGQVGWIDDYLFDEELVLLGEDGAPFFDKSKPIAYIINGKSWVNNHAHVLRARVGVTSSAYVKYYLDWFDYTDYVQGSTRDKLTQGAMKAIPVFVPPLELQAEIVRRIEASEERKASARVHLEQARASLDRARYSGLEALTYGRLMTNGDDASDDLRTLLEVVYEQRDDQIVRSDLSSGWQCVPLGDLISVGPQNGLYLPQTSYGSGTPILRIENYGLTESDDKSAFRRVRADASDVARFSLCVGDLVINRVNSPSHLGKSLLVGDRHVPALFESNMMRFRVNEACVEPRWIDLILRSLRGRQLLTKNAKWAVNQASINQEDVARTPIPLPEPAEQRAILAVAERFLHATDSLAERINLLDHQLDRVHQALLCHEFSRTSTPLLDASFAAA